MAVTGTKSEDRSAPAGAAGPPIATISASAYTVPTDRPESDGTLAWDSTTIVVVEATAAGQRGLGYSYANRAAVEIVSSLLAAAVVGNDALAPPLCWSAMQRAVRNAGRQGLCAMAVSAVDIALWDLRARLLGVSLADSLGRFRDAIPAYGSGGFTSYSDEDLRRQLEGWIEAGFDQVKIKVGREPGRDPERLSAARAAIGPGVRLMVDANGAFTRKQASRWASRLGEWDVSYFEEPVPSDDLDGLRLLRDTAPAGIEIAAGEYAWDLPELEALAGCVDILQADLTRCAGITNVRRGDGICRARQVPFSAHCAPQVSAHACCAMETAVHVEYFHDHARVERLLFDGALEAAGGELRPDPASPGLGIELKRADAERFRV